MTVAGTSHVLEPPAGGRGRLAGRCGYFGAFYSGANSTSTATLASLTVAPELAERPHLYHDHDHD